MRRTLPQWLEYQQGLHPATIALGLERVRAVAQRLAPDLLRPAPLVIVVAGTNGKGSAVAILRAILTAAGLRVGCYTSPHLLTYNERIVLPEGEVADATLIDWFERIEAARADIPLTFFEFGTLTALGVFGAARLDAVILEVGLGGRLDAVNLVDADAALITTIDLDHQDWLGPDRDSIGREKAGVLRPAQLAVYADARPVRSVLDSARQIGTQLLLPARDYRFWREGRDWLLHMADGTLRLPWPDVLRAPAQIHNLAACVALLRALAPRWPLSIQAFKQGLAQVRIRGRLQVLAQQPELVLDIAHNPQAALSLAQWLAQAPDKPTVALLGALADKDIAGIVAPLLGSICEWVVVGLDQETPRGLSAAALVKRLPQAVAHRVAANVIEGLALARARAGSEGRVLAFGSFYLAAGVLRATDTTTGG